MEKGIDPDSLIDELAERRAESLAKTQLRERNLFTEEELNILFPDPES